MGKEFLVFLPKAHPLQIREWSAFKLGRPFTTLPIDDKARKLRWPSLLCQISEEFDLSLLRVKFKLGFWLLQSL